MGLLQFFTDYSLYSAACGELEPFHMYLTNMGRNEVAWGSVHACGSSRTSILGPPIMGSCAPLGRAVCGGNRDDRGPVQ